MPPTIDVGLTKAGNQEKPLKHSESKPTVFVTNLEHMLKHTAIDLNKKPMPKQHRLPCEIKNALPLPGSVSAASAIRVGNKLKWQAVSQRSHAALLWRRSRSVIGAPGMQAT